VWLTAVLLVLPVDAVVSHTTAMRLYGLTLDDGWPLHVSTSTSTHSRLAGIVTHRRRGALRPVVLDGLPVTGADRTIVDIATKVRLVPLVQAIEHMIHRGHTTSETVMKYAMDRHLDGVRRVRRVMATTRAGSSPAATSSTSTGRCWSSTTAGTTSATRASASAIANGAKSWRPQAGD
jgi:predicted transcriptional regulator of viral defense system